MPGRRSCSPPGWPRSSRLPNVLNVADPPLVTVSVGLPVELKHRSLDADTKRIMAAISGQLPAEARGPHHPTPAELDATYPPGYLVKPTVDRVLEIVEKFEEDITDKARLHGQLKVVLDVGEAIEVNPQRERGASVDPLMVQIQESLQAMIDHLAAESPELPEPCN